MKNRKFCVRHGYMGMGEGVGRGVLSPSVFRCTPTIIVPIAWASQSGNLDHVDSKTATKT